MMRIAIIASLLLATFSARAETPVHDPNGVLPEIRKFAGGADFASAFKCGTQTTLKVSVISGESFKCGPDWCMGSVKAVEPAIPVNRQVISCSPDEVGVLNDFTGDLQTYLRADFERFGGNPVELFLKDLDVLVNYPGAEATIREIKPATYKFNAGLPTEREAPALHVFGFFGEVGMRQTDFVITVVAKIPAVAQIVRFRFDDKTWFLGMDFAEASK